QALGQANEDRIGAALKRRRFGIVENREIDVARIIELICAELAERKDGEAAARLWLGHGGELQASRASGVPQQKAQGGLEKSIGGARERERRLNDVGDA